MKKLFLLLLTVLAIGLCASAQTRTVTGTVVDAQTQEELIGVSVTAGPGIAVATDAYGKFSLKVPTSIKTLDISYVGYKSEKVEILPGDMRIELHPNSEMLQETIVVAYGKQSKASFTGSAATVSSASIEKTQVTNALDALSGKVAGLQLSNASGDPGGNTPTIRVRGFSSLMADNGPLVIVDGSPYSGDISSLNTNDIESMTVLKDAASNALYGARGANGVILITTKRAKYGEAVVTVDAKWGHNARATQDYKYIKDPRQYYEAYYRALYNFATMPYEGYLAPNATAEQNIGGLGYTPEQATAWANAQLCTSGTYGLGYQTYSVPEGQYLIGYDGRMNPNARPGYLVNGFLMLPDDWLAETYKSGFRQEYNVNISQGTERSNLMLSAGYLDNGGIVAAPSSFQRFTARVNADFMAKSWLKVGVNAAYTHTKYENGNSGEGSAVSTGNIFAAATGVAPIYPMYMRDAEGNIMVDDLGITRYDYGAGLNGGMRRPVFAGSNALSDANLGVGKSTANQFTGTGFFEIRLPYDFTFTSNNSVGIDETRSNSMSNPFYGQFAPQNGIVGVGHSRLTDITYQQLINWNHSYGDNNISVLLGHEYYKRISQSLSGTKSNMFLPSNDELAGSITEQSSNSGKSIYNVEGWLGRAQYDYAQKYFVSASVRRDASSNFHPDHRWGTFWSLGGAWIISKEDFFNVDWVNQLKFKISYGEQGNDQIGSFRYVDTYSLINASGMPGASPSAKGNENITWEKGGNFNAGFEFTLFNSRLDGGIEGFYRKTTDMLMYFPLPASSGFMGYYDNVGDMMNAGLEVELNGDIIKTRDFRWSMGLNLTYYKNKITYLPEERKGMTVEGYRGYQGSGIFYGEGLPMYTQYLFKYAGVDPNNGLALYYKDVLDAEGNPTGEVTTTHDTSQASRYLSKSMLAPVYGGFNMSFDYKNFDLSLNFNYQIGGHIYDSNYSSLMGVPTETNKGGNFHEDLLNAWSPSNPNSEIPRFQFGDLYTTATSTRFIVDASYLSLQNINFGYTLPSKLVKKMYLNKLRVYFAAENVWVWSQRQGLDPRQSFTGGVNNTYNAPVRTLSGGLTVTF